MTENNNELDLRKAFPDMPGSCHTALMDAAHSVRDETAVGRHMLRPVLIAAVIMVMTIAVAAAATKTPGWADILEKFGISVPKDVSETMKAGDETSWKVGPCTFTVTEQIADARIAFNTFEITMSDSSKALLMPEGESVSDPIYGSSFDREHASKLGITEGSSWGEAAKQLNIPLYRVNATVDADGSVSRGLSIQDSIWEAENRMLFFDMEELKAANAMKSIPINYCFSVSEIDPDTGETIQNWTSRDHHTEMEIQPLLNEKTYSFAEGASLNGLPVVSVKAQQYITGVYVKVTVAKDEIDEDVKYHGITESYFTDAEGNRLQKGMNLTTPLETDSGDWDLSSEFSFEVLLGIDMIPENMKLVYEDSTIELN